MKNILKGTEPALLRQYRINRPNQTWDKFKQRRSRRQQLKSTVIADQGGICAYCEIDLKGADNHGNADFRVEHFHPKSDDTTAHNWHLNWQNLLGCCHGGSCKNVLDAASRFTSPDHSCDVPKGDRNLSGIILNPLTLPAFPPIFSCDRASGELKTALANCQQASVSAAQATNTLDELRLNAQRLTNLRITVLNKLNVDMQRLIQSGMDVGPARLRLAGRLLRKDNNGHWPPFFSTIRAYLGNEAEQHLTQIGYTG